MSTTRQHDHRLLVHLQQLDKQFRHNQEFSLQRHQEGRWRWRTRQIRKASWLEYMAEYGKTILMK